MATTTHKSGVGEMAADTLRSLAGKASGKRAQAIAKGAPGVFEFFLAAAIGILAAKLAFTLFAPPPTPPALPVATGAQGAGSAPVELTHTPFRVAAVEATAPAPDTTAAYEETQLDLTLHGVFVLGGIPTAIISTPDGKQGSFGLGDSIWSNATLERIVSSEQVVMLVSGARETLTLKNRDPKDAVRRSQPTGPRPVAPPPTAIGGIPIGDIANISVALSPDGPRLVLQPGRNKRAFEAAGLKPGDVVVAVNNRRIGSDLASESRRFAALAQSGKISLLVERNGTPVPVEIRTSRNGR